MPQDKPPIPFKQGLNAKALNERFTWIYEHILIPAGAYLTGVPGQGGQPGLLFGVPSTGGGGSINYYPWQTYPSKWQGDGADPNASDRKMRFLVIPGQISNRKPSNMTQEWRAFGVPTDKSNTIVVTFLYAQAPITEGTVGSNQIVVGKPELKIVQGTENQDLVDVLGPPPAFGSDGAVPAYVIIALGEVWYFGGVLHFYPGYASYLGLTLVGSGGCENTTRTFQVVGTERAIG